MIEFKSRKDKFFNPLQIITILLLLIVGTAPAFNQPKVLTICLVFLPVLLVVCLLFWNTLLAYTKRIVYKSGPIKGLILIQKIKKIEVGKTSWIGLKPATARNGLIVSYNRFDSVYITPKSNQILIQEILQRNSRIEIVNE